MSSTCGPSTRAGDKVIFSHPGNGYPYDRELCAAYLTEGATYTVSSVSAQAWETRLRLEGVPMRSFNSVNFTPAAKDLVGNEQGS